MKALLIDDEPLALKALRKQLEQTGRVQVAAACTNVNEALLLARQLQPDVIFLDIQMPEMSGLEAAELFYDAVSDVDIVFVTAHDEFAVQAFEINATDYLLKPVNYDRLSRTLSHLTSRPGRESRLARQPASAIIRCFHQLQLETGRQLPVSWRTAKAQELFAYLVHKRRDPASKEHLLSAIWPDAPSSREFSQLYGTIYQIRKTLSSVQLPVRIENTASGYVLQLHDTQLDVELWEQGVREAMATEMTEDSLPHCMRCFEMYTGHYFGEYDYLWAESERERLRRIWYAFSVKLGTFLHQSLRLKEALHVYHRILTLEPYDEDVQWQTMKLYLDMNNWSAVEKQYAGLTQLLHDELDAQPRADIQQWMEEHRLR